MKLKLSLDAMLFVIIYTIMKYEREIWDGKFRGRSYLFIYTSILLFTVKLSFELFLFFLLRKTECKVYESKS